MQPQHRLEELDQMGSFTTAGNAVGTPKQLLTPIGINNYSRSAHSTPYTMDGSPYLAYPGSAPFILPMQPIPQTLPYYPQTYQGTSHDLRGAHSNMPTSIPSKSLSFDRGKSMYMQHPQSPSPIATPTSTLKAGQERYWDLPGPSYISDAHSHGHHHSSQLPRRTDSRIANRNSHRSHAEPFGLGRTVATSQYSIPRVTPADGTGGHQRFASGSTSISVPNSVSLHMRRESSPYQYSSLTSPVTDDHGHQRSWSYDTASRHMTPGSKDVPHRMLEIRCSATEGRRLVFPDKNATVGSSSGVNESEDGISVQGSSSQVGLPFTPDREASTKGARSDSVPMLSLTTGADGAAVIGRTNTSRANLDWMPHHVQSPIRSGATESESDACLMIGQLALRTPKRSKGNAPVRDTDSVKRRKRLEAFSETGHTVLNRISSGSPSHSKTKGKSPRSDRELSMSRIAGFGRLAVKEDVASRFLHLEPPQLAVSHETPMPFEDQSSARKAHVGSSRTDLGDRTSTSSHLPDWPDVHAPWAQETQWERDNKIIRATKLEGLRFASIERYLEEASDTEQDASDSKLVLTEMLRKRGITSKDSANACEAVLHARRNGRTVMDRELEASTTLPIIGPNEENGCLCGGSNDKGGAMVCCDSCSVWYHLACCGIQTEDELDDQWFCQRCRAQTTPQAASASTTMQEAQTRFPSTPEPQLALGPAFAATNESTRSYHAHTSDAALAPSPTFSPTGRFPISLMDTPALYTSPRMTSGSSIMSRNATPGTPMIQPRLRVVSYAEHYNVCQTPGASDSDYKKIYSTPKFEDFFESGLQPSSVTPALRNRSSPMESTESASGSEPAFYTPSSSQNFLRSLQAGSSAPVSDMMTSTNGLSSALIPNSPLISGSRNKYPAGITDSISPSPYREHRRQISFGARVTSFGAYASHLRDHSDGESTSREPLRLGEELSRTAVEGNSLPKDSGAE